MALTGPICGKEWLDPFGERNLCGKGPNHEGEHVATWRTAATDDEFGVTLDPCEHPSVNGGECAVCGLVVDRAPVVDRAVSLLVNASRVSPQLRQSMLIVEQELARLSDVADACAAEAIGLRLTLQAVWEECEDFVGFDPVREQVKQALGIREFEGGLTDG